MDSREPNFSEPVVGIFDRNNQFPDLGSDSFTHVSCQLDKSVDKQKLKKLVSDFGNAQNLLITVEMPGRKAAATSENVLSEVLDGDYDAKIDAFCEALKVSGKKVYVRWNPEMEVPVKIYPWQYQAPADYIKAFNHFAKQAKKAFPGIQIVWGAAGYPGADEYYPGSENVDFMTIMLNGKSEKESTAFPDVKDLYTNLKRKIQRMRVADKPILVLAAGDLQKDEDLKTQLTKAINETKKEAVILYSDFDNGNALANNARTSKPLVGVYDPKEIIVKSGLVGVEHIFVDLGSVQSGQFEQGLNAIAARKHDAIVSIEPWRDNKSRKDSSVLLNVINGVYDAEFSEIYRVIGNSKQTVYLRFAHEMEIPIHRYAWQSQDPVLYIKAFRYFMDFNKSNGKNIKKVWGPAGDRGSMEWWPGAKYVDYVSIAIYGLPDKGITDPEKQESFESIYNRKNHRMRFTGKPIFVTEFGVKGREEYQAKWMKNAARVINTHKEIFGVCYFNLEDNPKVWGDIPAPDWSLSKATFSGFVDALQE
ncbi:glycoside hydrolase family 26 protein [Dyadobacter psychrophilus]|nr:hypothetical protein [Dyadobacter psychrophilus]